MGDVYRARDPRLERFVAIKLLPTALAADSHARERLRREAMAALDGRSPAIQPRARLRRSWRPHSRASIPSAPNRFVALLKKRQFAR